MTVRRLLTEADSRELTRWLVLYQVEAGERARAEQQQGGQ